MLVNKGLIHIDMQCPVGLMDILNSFDQKVVSKLIAKLLNYSLEHIIDKENVLVERRGQEVNVKKENGYKHSIVSYKKVYIKNTSRKFHICFNLDTKTLSDINRLKVYKDGENRIITFKDLDYEIENNALTRNKIYITLLTSCLLFKKDLFDKGIIS